jgi:lauroyl/myristoyl acyltransferase
MQPLLFFLGSVLVRSLQALPLKWVARLGWAGGELSFWLDRRHREITLMNLRQCFGNEMSEPQIHRLARENFRRIGESFACAVKTAGMKPAAVLKVFEVEGLEKLSQLDNPMQSRLFVLGHFGNFELFTHASHFLPGAQFATTYRGLREPALDRLLQSLRSQSGCQLFERRSQAAELKNVLNQLGTTLGLLADQHAGRSGLQIPFFGRTCSTSAAPAIFALRYDMRLHPAICYRVAIGRWRIEVGDEIATRENGALRSTEAITLEINQAFEKAVRRDPANWFWVHNRWKSGAPKSTPPRFHPARGARPDAAENLLHP